MRRYRLAVPALLVTGAYVATLVVVPARGDHALMHRLTLLHDEEEGLLSALLGPNVPVMVLAGAVSAWALWQSLRGPAVGRAAEPDRAVRALRVALYAAVASCLVYAVVPEWPQGARVIDAGLMAAVVVGFFLVLRRTVGHAGLLLGAGLLAQAIYVADELGAPVRDLDVLAAVAEAVWWVLVWVAQWRDGRWRRDTVGYGAGMLVVPLALILLTALLAAIWVSFVPLAIGVRREGTVFVEAFLLIWLARSAHDLGEARGRAAPARPGRLPAAGPPWLAATVRIGACAVLLLPPLVNLYNGHVLWFSAHAPARWLSRLVGDVLMAGWWAFELFVGIGGPAVVVLVALRTGSGRMRWAATLGLLVAALAGLMVEIIPWMPDRYHLDTLLDMGLI